MTFDRFIGIDWSGDKNAYQKGIKVAQARPGRQAPVLVAGPGRSERWSRTEVMRFILESCAHERCLVGLDFAFGFPANHGPFDWAYVEAHCAADGNFYGGRFFHEPAEAHADFINSSTHKGARYRANAHRVTELRAALTKGATPQTVFNAIGAAQVGPSSISGMRMLRMLTTQGAQSLSVWPFAPVSMDRSVVVEIFPRLFPLLHRLPSAMKVHANLNRALAAFESDPVTEAPRSEDEGDALISSAALRQLSAVAGSFVLPQEPPAGEGWIFGVR